MERKVINLSDFSKEIEGFTNAAIEEQRAAVVRGLARSIPELVKASPVDTGLYASSWDLLESEKSVIIGNYAPHAPIIEYGTRPGHKVPIRVLLAWAKRVLKDPSQPPEYSDAVWGLAVYTQKKIFEEGIQPKAVLEKAIPMIIENIRREFEAGAKQ